MSTPNSNGETKLFGNVSSAAASSEFAASAKQATATTSASFNAADLDDIKLSDLQFLNGNVEAARRRSGRSVSVSSSGSDSSSDDDGNDGDENVLDVVRRREERERDGRVKNELLEELCMECGVSDSFELAEQLFSTDARRRVARTTDQSGAARPCTTQQDQTASAQRAVRAQPEPDTSPRSQATKALPSSTAAPNATDLDQLDASTLDFDADFEWLRYADPQLFELPASEQWAATTSAPSAAPATVVAAANTPTITQLDGGTQSQHNTAYYTQLDTRQTQPVPLSTYVPSQTSAQVAYPYRTDYPPAQTIYGVAQPQLVSSYSRCNYKRVPEWHSAASPSPLNSPARTAADTPYSNALAQAHGPHAAGFSTKRACVDVPYRDASAVVGESAPQLPADSDESESEDDTEQQQQQQQHNAPVPPLVPASVMTSLRNESGQLAPMVGSGAPTYSYPQRLPESDATAEFALSQPPNTRANAYWQPTASAFMPIQSQPQPQPQPQPQQSVAQASMYYPTATSTSTTWYTGASNSYTPATSQQCHNVNVNVNAAMPYASYDQTRAVRPDVLAGPGDPQQAYSAVSYTSYAPPTSDACCNYATMPGPPQPASVGDPCAGSAAWTNQTQDPHKAAQLAELRAHPYYALLRDLAETEIKFASVDVRFNWRVLMLNLPTELNRLLNNFRLRNPSVDVLMQRRRELVAAGRASPHLDTVVFSAIQNAHASLIAKLRSKSLEAAAASGAALNCVPAPAISAPDCLSVNAPPRATGATLWPSAPVQAPAPPAPTASLLHRTSADLAGAVAERQLAVGLGSNATVQHAQQYGWAGETPQTAGGLRTVSNRPSQPQTQPCTTQAQPQQQAQSQTQSQPQPPATTSAAAQPQASARKKSWLPDSSKAVLLNWLGRHLTNPYPSDDEKEQLAQLTGLQLSQVNYWFTNARRRILPKMLAVVHAHALQPPTLTSAPAHPHQQTAAAASAVP